MAPSAQQEIQQSLILTQQDIRTLTIMGIYAGVIFVLWNFPYLKYLLHPFKLIVTALHEFGHASTGKCTGAKIKSIEVDADTGGVTHMQGGNPYVTLPAGYLGTALFGGLMVFAGFDILASKIVGAIIGVCFLATLYWAKGWIARILAVVYCGAVAFLWWFQSGEYLPYIVLFLGVMCCLQSLWDFQGLILFKHPQSDATKYAELDQCCPAQVWGFIWCIVGLAVMAFCALLGVMAFNNVPLTQ